MKKGVRVIVGIFVFIAIAIGVLLFIRYNEDRKYRAHGEFLISKIEGYRQQTGRLPDSVSDLRIEEEMGEGPYYEKIDSLNYIVYFSIGFDNAKIYYSETEEWRDEP